MTDFSPREIVSELDRFIVGQADAKRAVAIALRNRWVAIAVAMMVLFSLVLSAAGSAPTGALGADRLSVVVASLTSLAVYLVPLVALLMSFDALAGEVERGTLPLLLTYPLSRAEIILGKLAAHLAVMAVALAWLRKRAPMVTKRIAIAGSLAVVLAGAYWFVDRVLNLGSG